MFYVHLHNSGYYGRRFALNRTIAERLAAKWLEHGGMRYCEIEPIPSASATHRRKSSNPPHPDVGTAGFRAQTNRQH